MSEANKTQVGGKHYKEDVIQHWDVMLANDVPYMEGQIIKYVWRWKRKNGIEDLRKARHFLDKLIEHEMMQNIEREAAHVETEFQGYIPPSEEAEPGHNYIDPDHQE